MMFVLNYVCLAQRPVTLTCDVTAMSTQYLWLRSERPPERQPNFVLNPLRANFSEPTFGLLGLADALRSDKCNDRHYFLLSVAVTAQRSVCCLYGVKCMMVFMEIVADARCNTGCRCSEMSKTSLSLVVYDPRLLQPPPAFMLMEMVHDIIVIENTLPQAPHPHDIRDMISDLQFMFATMRYCGDWSLCSRVSSLLHQARNMAFQLSHEYVRRCAVLVDACRTHQHTLLCCSSLVRDCIYCRHTFVDSTSSILPSYDAMALAVTACDDVLPYIRPLCKAFYIRDLRPCLVSFMEDSESADSDNGVHEGLPVSKRLCV